MISLIATEGGGATVSYFLEAISKLLSVLCVMLSEAKNLVIQNT